MSKLSWWQWIFVLIIFFALLRLVYFLVSQGTLKQLISSGQAEVTTPQGLKFAAKRV